MGKQAGLTFDEMDDLTDRLLRALKPWIQNEVRAEVRSQLYREQTQPYLTVETAYISGPICRQVLNLLSNGDRLRIMPDKQYKLRLEVVD